MKLDEQALGLFRAEMAEREYSPATAAKYGRVLRGLLAFAGGEVKDKATLVAFKKSLAAQNKAAGTVNGALAAVKAGAEPVRL